jgi:hypothetical protein
MREGCAEVAQEEIDDQLLFDLDAGGADRRR